MTLSSGRRGALAAAAGAVAALALAAPIAHAADDCPNAAVRAQQGSAHLPECRAYELVSPVNKNGHAIVYAPMSDPAGGGIAFTATGAFADAPSSINGMYHARRGADGWKTMSYLFPTRADRPPYSSDEPVIIESTSDLSSVLYETYYPLFDGDHPTAVPTVDIFRRSADGRFDWITRPALLPSASTEDVRIVAASPDLQRVLFYSKRALVPEVVGETREHLYAREGDGPIVLVSVDPSGLPFESNMFSTPRELVASDDLSRTVFRGQFADGRVFMRTDPFDPARAATRPIALSADGTVQCAGTDAIAVGGLSRDGRRVLFSCNRALTPDGVDGAGNLYLRDLDTGAIRRIGGQSAGGQAVTPDLSRIWLSDVATRRAILVRDGVPEPLDTWSAPSGAIAATSADGEHHVSTSSQAHLPGANGSEQVYLISARDRTTTCVSCPPDGSRPAGSAWLRPQSPYNIPSSRGRRFNGFVSPDGRRVFFTSDRALVPEDRNGVADAYAWIDGRHHLLSSGTDAEPSSFVNASADGRDAFIITAESLVPQDVDNGVADVYSVRVDGGFAVEQKAPRCVTDCQGPPPADQRQPAPGTVVFHGPGDSDDAPVAPTAKVFAVKPLGAAARRALARGRAATLQVRVSHAGRVRAAIRARIGRRTVTAGSASRTATAGGQVSLRLRLSASARRQLRSTGRLRVTVRVTWSQQRGAQQATFVLRAPRGGRR